MKKIDFDGRERDYLAISEYPSLSYTSFAAFFYAEVGAMGMPGEIKIITKDCLWYTGNFCYGDISVDSIYKMFPAFETFFADGFGGAQCVPEGFYYVYLGMGNHLLVNKDYERETREALEVEDNFSIYQGVLESVLLAKRSQKCVNGRNDCGDIDEQTQVMCLPRHCSQYQDFYSMIKQFVLEYQNSRYSSALKRGKHLTSVKNSNTCVHGTYISSSGHQEITPRRDLAVLIGARNGRCVRVDQILASFVNECKEMLLNGNSVDGMCADPQIVAQMRQMYKMLGSTVSIETAKSVTGIKDDKTFGFFCDVLGMRKSEHTEALIPCISRYSLIKFERNLGKVLKYFRHEVIHIRVDKEFKLFLNKTFSEDEETKMMFQDFVRNSSEFIWGKEQGEDVVALRWDLLQYAQAEVCWILYEQGAVDLKTALPSYEIQSLYWQKARRYGRNERLNDNILSTEQRKLNWRLINVGKSKYWLLRENRNQTFSIDDFVVDYFRHNNNDDWDGFKLAVESEGFDSIYDETSIKNAFYRNGGRIGRYGTRQCDAVNRYAPELIEEILDTTDTILDENGGLMQFSELYNEILKNYPDLNRATFLQWVKGKNDRYDYNPGKGRQSSIIARSGNPNKNHSLSYRSKIKHLAVEYLLSKNDYSEKRSIIYNLFKKEVPSSVLVAPALSSIFGDTELFQRRPVDGNGEVLITLQPDVVEMEMAKRPSRAEEVEKNSGITEEQAAVIYKKSPQYEWEGLKETLKKQLYRPFNLKLGFDMEKALNAMYYIMANGEDKVKESSAFHLLLSALPDHYNHMLAADREAHLKDDCTSVTETYLRNFYRLKYKSDLNKDIAMDYNKRPTDIGLGTILIYFDSYLNILPYKSFQQKGGLEYTIKESIWRIAPARIEEVGHKKNFQDRSAITIETRIHDVLSLFAFLANKL